MTEGSSKLQAAAADSQRASLLKGVRISLRATLGDVEMSVDDLLALKSGSVVKLDRHLKAAIELRLNDQVVARGEIVAVDDNFGVRITEVLQSL